MRAVFIGRDSATGRIVGTTPAPERFWHFVEGGSGCWNWSGARHPKGYGLFWDGKRLIGAHRFSYELHVGSIPTRLFICHHCDNPGCVRPEHLFVGSAADNRADMLTKGRWRLPRITPRFDGDNPATKINADKLADIRSRHSNGASQVALAREHGVSQTTIWRIVHGHRQLKRILGG